MNAPTVQARPIAVGVRTSLPGFVILATSVFLFVGLGAMLAWLYTGRVQCAAAFFRGPGGVYQVFLAALQFSLCRMVVRQFSQGEPLRPAWFLIMLSGGCHIVSAVCLHILSVHSPLNPLTRGPVDSLDTASNIYRFGLLVGGPVQLLLMASGLGWMLRLCRRSGMLLPKVRPARWVAVSIPAVLTCLQIEDLMATLQAGQDLSLYDLMSASTGPLLMMLLVQAILVRSYMSAVDGGMIARCWSSFAAAIFFTALGSLGLWMDSRGLLPAAPATMSYFVAYLAATALALGPAWQIEAIQSACGKVGVPRFSPMLTSLTALRLLNRTRP